MFFQHDTRYPFPGARTVFRAPFEVQDYGPKLWRLNAFYDHILQEIQDGSATFITSGVVSGDPIYITDSFQGFRGGTLVDEVIAEDVISLDFLPQENPTVDLAQVHYKVGEAYTHTLNTLAAIIVARGLLQYTIKSASLWTDGQEQLFFNDERGDIYVIDPEEGRMHSRRWKLEHPELFPD